MLKLHLSELAPGADVSVIPDSYNFNIYEQPDIVPTLEEALKSSRHSSATIVLAAVKPFRNRIDVEAGSNWHEEEHRKSRELKNGYDFDAMSRVFQFHYSVPFTKQGNKAYAKTLDKQWKRTTYLTTKDSFPFVNIRSCVLKRGVRDLSPIENGISDLEEVIQQCHEQLNAPQQSKENSNISDLKRFVQGIVVAQVILYTYMNYS